MKALVTLEWGMNVPVLTKLQSKLCDLKDKIKLHVTDTYDKPFTTISEPISRRHQYYNAGTISIDVIEFLGCWIDSTDCVLEPTWRNFFGILKDTSLELGQLAYQIKKLFHGILIV